MSTYTISKEDCEKNYYKGTKSHGVYSPDYINRPWKNFQKIIIEEGTSKIGTVVFQDCKELTELVIPNSVKKHSPSAFFGCDKLYLETNGDTLIRIPSETESFKIPSHIKIIKDCVFYDCSKLTSIEIPSSVSSINCNVFYGCTSLKKINIPSKFINKINFTHTNKKFLSIINFDEQNNKVGNVIIPDGVTEITWFFKDCAKIKSIEIPTSVKEIEGSSFKNCVKLAKIQIPSSVTLIGSNSFYNCRKLKNIEIPSSVSVLGNCSFKNCKRLTSIEIPSSVTRIGNDAFKGCTNLKNITIHENAVEKINLSKIGLLDCCKVNVVTINQKDFITETVNRIKNIQQLLTDLKFELSCLNDTIRVYDRFEKKI